MHTADHHLLERWIRERDAQAFKAITSKYCAMVYATSVRILRNSADAEEVTQECFVSLAKMTRGLQGPVGAWLHRVATYQALNRRRNDRRRREREDQFVRSYRNETEIEWDDISQFIDQSIEALPDKIRVAIVGHFIEDISVTALAAREGVTHGAISQRIQKGVTLIRERMQKNGISIAGAALGAMLAEHASATPALPVGLVPSLGKLALSGARYTAETPSGSAAWLGTAQTGVAAAIVIAMAAIGYVLFQQPEAATAAETGKPRVRTVSEEALRKAFLTDEAISAPETASFPAAAPEAAPSPSPPEPIIPELTTWREVVDAYTTHQNRIRRISFDYEHESKGSYYWYNYAPNPGYREFFQRGSLVTDGERCYMRQYKWGHTFGGDPVPADRPSDGIFVFDGNTCISHLRGGAEWFDGAGSVQIHPNARESAIRNSAFRDGRIYLLFGRYPGGLMLDMPLDQGWRMEELLYNAKRINLLPEIQKVQGLVCYVVVADTPYGQISAWFSPERDFNIVQSVIELGAGDIYENSPMLFGTSARYEYLVERFTQIDGLWVPIESTSRQIARLRGGNGHDYSHRHKRSNVKLLAAGEDDDAYVIHAKDIRNGAWLMVPVGTIRHKGDPRWIWQDNQFVLSYDEPNGKVPRKTGKGRGFGGGIIAGTAL